MKTPEEIKKLKLGLESCSSDECHGDHGECPYKNNVRCVMTIAGEAIVYIEQLEETISLMKIQMRGDCGCCLHGKDGEMTTCNKCLTSKGYHPLWEYEGLPEVKRHDKPL